MVLTFPDELIIDNFAGGGGTSTGLEAAFGRPVDVAINHDPEALAMHALNHPHTRHLLESVWNVDPIALTGKQPVGLVWLSPDCKHFSKAKGGTPVSRAVRGLAWVTMRWAALCRPRVIMVENVSEFQTWGPLIISPDGSMRPDPKRRGKTFESFVRQLRQHGYMVDWRELRACDHGAPTIRKRLFLVARRDGLPIVWPEQSHGAPGSREVLAGALAPYRTAAECIDFSLPAESIFNRKKPLAVNTQRRVAKGLFRHVLSSPKPFIVTNTTGHAGAAADAPLPTITTGGHHMVVAPVLTSFMSGASCTPRDEHAMEGAHLVTIGYGDREGRPPRAQDIRAPLGTVVTAKKHALVVVHLTHHGECAGTPPAEPLRTVTGAHRGEQAMIAASLVSAFFEQANGGFYEGDGRAADAPLSTITATGSNQRMVTAYLVKYYSSGGQWQRADEPMHTLPTKGRMGLVQAVQVAADCLSPEHREKARRCAGLLHEHIPEHFPELTPLVLMSYGGTWWVLVDITLRMLKARELYRAQAFPDSYIIDQIPDPLLLFRDGVQVGDPLTTARVPLTSTAQIRMCGNSVAPVQAEALVRANFRHSAQDMGHAGEQTCK
ncbi:DNA cytosine methyltransferase [Verminephrobacter aporrectodeae]|uniref:DNA cytosine methyltransferase n=1 Tax=Verminephrobacter aporrectodeae TaxID=1110389 RepID=UPI00223842C7|nr:DNA cytosine methyltransferase [Verminephrobacter aporrectodeae]